VNILTYKSTRDGVHNWWNWVHNELYMNLPLQMVKKTDGRFQTIDIQYSTLTDCHQPWQDRFRCLYFKTHFCNWKEYEKRSFV